MRPQLPRGATIQMRGQAQTMRTSFIELGVGLVMAIVMVYLLIVVNFQSWIDAFIIITALPAALAGICWMLFLTATTLSVPALTGAIMTMGVATANSILIVSFARQRMNEGLDPVSAARDAGATRIRPVLMTALAMIIGMIPMALGLGEGAEQNAPLGRAVIGGLLFATVSTLFFVPVIFAGMHRRLEQRKNALFPRRAAGGRKCLICPSTQPGPGRDSEPSLSSAESSVLFLIGGVIVLGVRSFQARALEASTEIHAKQYVTTISPKRGRRRTASDAAGHTAGNQRSDGVCAQQRLHPALAQGHRQRGQKGRAAGEIAAPEIDEELSQAIAAQQQAASGESLAKSTADRWKSLRESDAVTQQDLDERLSAYQQAQANLAAAKANTARLRNLQGFNQVVAPFDGVVTSRSIDVGDLVDAGNGGAGKTLFTIAQVDPLRLYVYVPQVYAGQVKVGDAVTVALPERAGQEYQGTIARTARAIDVGTRTMQVEIRVPNPGGALLAGAYVQASLPIKQDAAALLVPTNVLLFRPDGAARRCGRCGRPRAFDRGETRYGFRQQRGDLERPQARR